MPERKVLSLKGERGVVLSVWTQLVAMQMCVGNNCQVPLGEPVVSWEDVSSFSEYRARGAARGASGDRSRFQGKCSSCLVGLLPSGLFIPASRVWLHCTCCTLTDGVAGRDVYLSKCPGHSHQDHCYSSVALKHVHNFYFIHCGLGVFQIRGLESYCLNQKSRKCLKVWFYFDILSRSSSSIRRIWS